MGYGNPPLDDGTETLDPGTVNPAGEGSSAPPVENPIVAVDLVATDSDRFFYVNKPEQQYVGLYHQHEDGTLMIGSGELDTSHEIDMDEVIYQKFDYETLQEVREIVSDIFYKLWFLNNTLTEEEVLTLQTTIRDGKKTLGRSEDEPLVFFKKDRNTLESRKDLQGDTFEVICQHVYDNNVTDISSVLSLSVTSRGTELIPPDLEELGEVIDYIVQYSYGSGQMHNVLIATKIGNVFTDVLNLGQLTVPKTTEKIDPFLAKEILDTDIFELLPTQSTRQEEINNFFVDFNDLIGPTPAFEDVDNDGIGESIPDGGAADSGSRISEGNVAGASITRLDSQANELNQGQTLETMRNRLNFYLGDVDNVVQSIEDQRPAYENVSDAYLKIRRPNQSIILRSPDNSKLTFSKPTTGEVHFTGQGLVEVTDEPSYLVDGFTITMWVRFLSKTSEGTLFNYGNPLELSIPGGFRLDTKVNEMPNGKVYRYFRLMVDDFLPMKYESEFHENRIDDIDNIVNLRDNHTGAPADYTMENGNNWFGYDDESGAPLGRINQRITPTPHSQVHRAYPHYEIKDYDDWYFICATYNPKVDEKIYRDDENEYDVSSPYYNGNNPNSDMIWTGRNYWMNHLATVGAPLDLSLFESFAIGTLSSPDTLNMPNTYGNVELPIVHQISNFIGGEVSWDDPNAMLVLVDPNGVVHEMDTKIFGRSGDEYTGFFMGPPHNEGYQERHEIYNQLYGEGNTVQVAISIKSHELDTPNPNALLMGWDNAIEISESDESSVVSESGQGAKCKVEFISRSDLLRARGYKLPEESLRMETIEEEPDGDNGDDDGDDGGDDSGDDGNGYDSGDKDAVQDETSEENLDPGGDGQGGM